MKGSEKSGRVLHNQSAVKAEHCSKQDMIPYFVLLRSFPSMSWYPIHMCSVDIGGNPMYLGHSPVQRFLRCDMSPQFGLSERSSWPRGEPHRPATKPETKQRGGSVKFSFFSPGVSCDFLKKYTVQSDPDLPDYFPPSSKQTLLEVHARSHRS